ncbi:MerR family transcriptional regulator [Paraburkholderia fungorum]|jgi:hypothetical protein|uniref:Helix-turn-helix domain-containing protein n=1 Tax=Paraburkholderia fungorum TaxID=134537 RepID=A0AAP5Q507_9BURK|nr:MerR family transcriptional regulator [Paraburkholderia fungorum]MDT8837631.1 helix-turn-helix domain-containing protein [Paraburkholderia fungorum]USU16223.1 helix-turn-helix domain-containing protein [Paraburkholderia fungorum]USU24167.1 helix-turn-helix domain-containing protein [Paraburkholderia fungorum]
MNYTSQQVQLAVGIGQETLRYWRKALPPLAQARGHAACFTFSDLLSLKVVHLLVIQGGIAIGVVAGFADALFETCRATAPHSISTRTSLVIRPADGKVERATSFNSSSADALQILVPLSRCADELLQSLRENGETDPQISLPLPLAPVFAKG